MENNCFYPHFANKNQDMKQKGNSIERSYGKGGEQPLHMGSKNKNYTRRLRKHSSKKIVK